jgi:hypothetical protein
LDRIAHETFDILVQTAGSGYRAAVFAPAGDAVGEFVAPFTGEELRRLSDQLAPVGAASRRVLPFEQTALPDEVPDEVARTIGSRLFGALFSGAIGNCLQRSLDQMSRQGKHLVVRLRFPDAPELVSLPWEYLYDSQRETFLCLSDRVSVIRYMAGIDAVPALPVDGPLHVLVMISQPSDVQNLDVHAEWNALKNALDDLVTSGDVELEECTGSLEDLVPTLRQSQPHVFHYIGHGSFDGAGGGQLLFEADNGHGQARPGSDLGLLLFSHATLRLIVLNACDTARSTAESLFGGAAQRLLRMGAPAVVGMQYPVSDDAAVAFTREFYGALSIGYPLDAAMTEGRKAVFAKRRAAEWGTPVLYTRASDTRLFDIEPPSPTTRVTRTIIARLREAQAAAQAGRWDRAVQVLEAVIDIDPSNVSAAEQLRVARREQEISALYAQARADFDASRWPAAVAYFSRVASLLPAQHAKSRGIAKFLAIAEAELARRTTLPTSATPTPAAEARLRECVAAVLRKFVDGRTVIVVGERVNGYGRISGEKWRQGQLQYLPTNTELAARLASSVTPSLPVGSLVSVSQHYATVEGSDALQDELRTLLDADYESTSLHRLLATLPGRLRELGYPPRYPVLVTTNFDDVLERALEAAGEPFDLLAYTPSSRSFPAHFKHRNPDGEVRPVAPANSYDGLAVDKRTVVLKVYGALDRREGDYVVAEDDYIDYGGAGGGDMNMLLPATLLAKMMNSHVFFLGYNPGEWSLRVFFRRIWAEQPFSNRVAWAVGQLEDALEERFWRRRAVDVLDAPLEAFVAGALSGLDDLKPYGT